MLAVHETVHQRLARQGVRSIQFGHRDYAGSAYNRIASAGAEMVGHSTLAEGLVQLKEAVGAADGKALLGFYWAAIDSIAHGYGPGTPYHAAEIASFWHMFDEVFQRRRQPRHALPVHRRPRPRLCRRAPDALPQRALAGAAGGPAPRARPAIPSIPTARRAMSSCTCGRSGGSGRSTCCVRSSPRSLTSWPSTRRWTRACSARSRVQRGAAPAARRHPHPAAARPFRLVARAGHHGEPLLRPPRRSVAGGADHRARRDRQAVAGVTGGSRVNRRVQ